MSSRPGHSENPVFPPIVYIKLLAFFAPPAWRLAGIGAAGSQACQQRYYNCHAGGRRGDFASLFRKKGNVYMCKWILGLGLIFCIAGCTEPTPPSAAGNGNQPVASAQKYIELKGPLPGYDGKKAQTEVLEFFSYACDHCARFNPQLEQWKQSHAQIHVRKVPVLFSRPQFETLARLYFSLQDLGHGNLDEAAFAAIHVQNRDLSLPDVRMAWAKENGISPEDLERKMTSPEIASRVNEANELAVKAEIDGVPTLVVGGKYSISLDLAGSFENMLSTADSLIVK